MKLKVLVDNNTYIDAYYFGEPAVSYYIEDGDDKILLDVGYSDVFLKNAKAFDIDIQEVQTIVISHGHDDHTKGLQHYFEQVSNSEVTIVAHPDTFKEKRVDDLLICSPLLEGELQDRCHLKLSKDPMKISDSLYFLGEIPIVHDFEQRNIIGEQKENETFIPDYVLDDTALAYKGTDGLYIITGCSHSGICNIIEQAKKVTGVDKVCGVIGGFHLFDVDDQVIKTIQYFKDNEIEHLYPCHCTSFAVKAKIHETLPIHEVGVGLEVEWI